MTDDDSKQDWLRLVHEEQKAFDHAKGLPDDASPTKRENAARDWFLASSKLLLEFLWQNAYANVRFPGPFPGDAIGRIASLADALAQGRLPDPIVDATASGGRPGRWRGERRNIATAIRYVELAKAGEIQDRRPIVAVVEAFQVERSTVQRWLRDRGQICEGLPETPAEQFPEALRRAGARYHFNRKGDRTEGVE